MNYLKNHTKSLDHYMSARMDFFNTYSNETHIFLKLCLLHRLICQIGLILYFQNLIHLMKQYIIRLLIPSFFGIMSQGKMPWPISD